MIQWLGVQQCRSCRFDSWSGSLGPTCLGATNALMQLRPHTAKYIFFSFFKNKTWMGNFWKCASLNCFCFLHFSLRHDWKFTLVLNTFWELYYLQIWKVMAHYHTDFCYEEIGFHMLVLEDFLPTSMDAFKLSFLFSLIFGNFLMMNFGGVIFHSSFWALDKLFQARKSFKKIKYFFDNNFFFLFSLILFLELHL